MSLSDIVRSSRPPRWLTYYTDVDASLWREMSRRERWEAVWYARMRRRFFKRPAYLSEWCYNSHPVPKRLMLPCRRCVYCHGFYFPADGTRRCGVCP